MRLPRFGRRDAGDTGAAPAHTPSAPAGDPGVSRLSRALAFARTLPTLVSVPMLCLYVFIGISFVGTYTGMLEVLKSGDNRFGFWGTASVFAFILATTIIMAYSVGEMIRPGKGLLTRLSLIGTYVVTLLISVSFGFAFYWTQLEARGQAVGDASRILGSFNREVKTASQKLSNTSQVLGALAATFQERATIERTPGGGGQCSDRSSGGPGPRARHLQREADSISAVASSLGDRIAGVQARSDEVQAEIDQILALGDSDDDAVTPEQRQVRFREAARKAENAAVALQALADDEGIKGTIKQFRGSAALYNDPNHVFREGGGATFQCYNVGIANDLSGAANNLESLPILETPQLNAFVGAGATREALDRFWYTLAGPIRPLFFKDPEVSRDEQLDAAVRQGVNQGLARAGSAEAADAPPPQGLRFGGGDALPLGLALVIDGLLFLSSLWSRPGETFAAFNLMIRNLRKIENTPLDLIAGARALENDPNYQFLRPHVFEYANEIYLAVPGGFALATDPQVKALSNFRVALSAGGVLARENAAIPSRTILRCIMDNGNIPPSENPRYRAWRFNPRAYENMVMLGMIDPALVPRAATREGPDAFAGADRASMDRGSAPSESAPEPANPDPGALPRMNGAANSGLGPLDIVDPGKS